MDKFGKFRGALKSAIEWIEHARTIWDFLDVALPTVMKAAFITIILAPFTGLQSLSRPYFSLVLLGIFALFLVVVYYGLRVWDWIKHSKSDQAEESSEVSEPQKAKIRVGRQIVSIFTSIVVAIIWYHAGSENSREPLASSSTHQTTNTAAPVPSSQERVLVPTPITPLSQVNNPSTPEKPTYKRFYSSKQREEVANGLQELRISLSRMKTQLKEKEGNIEKSLSPMTHRWMFAVYSAISEKNISDSINAVREFRELTVELQKFPKEGNNFLNDPNYRKEVDSLLEIDDYSSHLNALDRIVSGLYESMKRVEKTYDQTHDNQITGYLMDPVWPSMANLRSAINNFDEWFSDVNGRADEIEKMLP